MSTTITAENLNLARILQSFYRVPVYQREYVWGEKRGDGGDEVEQFLNDIHTEYAASVTGKEPPEYFIGAIVVHKSDDANDTVYDLIDGQQRMTTVFLLLCALRNRLWELRDRDAEAINSRIFTIDADWEGGTRYRMRVILQYADACGVLEKYGKGELNLIPFEGTRTIQNLANSYIDIDDFLKKTFGDNPDHIKRFYGYLVNKVTMIRIEATDISRALKIFETINDRGVGLDAMDLLKNLLFMKANPKHFENIKIEWDAMIQHIYQAHEKPLRFLRYFIFARYDVKEAALAEDGIYDWLTKAKDQTGHERNPLGFVKELRQAAQDYAQFTSGQNRSGKTEHGLRNIQSISRPFRLHYILLLAGHQLSPSLFTRLCDNLEQIICLWLFTAIPARTYEATIIKAAQILRWVKTEEQFNDFSQDFFDKQKESYADAFRQALSAMNLADVSKDRVKYLLAKITQWFDVQADGLKNHEALSAYLSRDNEIEHILPQNADPEALVEFGEGADNKSLVHSLGNLILLERPLNSAAGNKPYSEKCRIYESSQFRIARHQKELPSGGVNDRITRVLRRLNPAPIWDRQAIEGRQRWYVEIAYDIWALPKPVSPSDAPPDPEDRAQPRMILHPRIQLEKSPDYQTTEDSAPQASGGPV